MWHLNIFFKRNSIRQNFKKLFVHHYTFRVKLLYIISFCFDLRPEALTRSLQHVFVHIDECRLERPGEMSC